MAIQKSLRCSTLVIAATFVCLLSNGKPVAADDVAAEQEYSKAFSKGQLSAQIKSSDLKELSGLVASQSNPGLFWAHNDSGDEARIFLIDPKTGDIKLEVQLENIDAVDFEDITLRTHKSQHYIVIGDIGDNRGVRDRLSLYQIREPTLGERQRTSIPSKEIQTMRIHYKEGARDAETLMSAPDGSLVILTKRENLNYIYQFEFEAGKEQQLTARSRISIKDITAGDIHSSGAILLRSYAQIYYWPAPAQISSNNSDFSVIKRLSNEAPQLVMTMPEPQGEAIAWTLDAGFYSIPEKPFFFEQIIAYYPPGS